MPISPSHFRPDPALLVLVQSESVYLIPHNAKPMRLNFSASFAWQQLSKGRSIDAVCPQYARRFGIDAQAARAEVDAFVTAMRESGYLLAAADAVDDHDAVAR